MTIEQCVHQLYQRIQKLNLLIAQAESVNSVSDELTTFVIESTNEFQSWGNAPIVLGSKLQTNIRKLTDSFYALQRRYEAVRDKMMLE